MFPTFFTYSLILEKLLHDVQVERNCNGSYGSIRPTSVSETGVLQVHTTWKIITTMNKKQAFISLCEIQNNELYPYNFWVKQVK